MCLGYGELILQQRGQCGQDSHRPVPNHSRPGHRGRDYYQWMTTPRMATIALIGINPAVNCDENVTVTNVNGSSVIGGDANHGLLAGILAIASSSSSGLTDDLTGESDENDESLGHFTHHWAVHIPDGDQQGLADRVATEHGFINRGKDNPNASVTISLHPEASSQPQTR
uniref:Peptidase S8 pro-domain domain-containing protein n=1 Tax=Anopheles farauti TaxID=69004 RepID=A0A182Q450_9DIPT